MTNCLTASSTADERHSSNNDKNGIQYSLFHLLTDVISHMSNAVHNSYCSIHITHSYAFSLKFQN